MPQKRRSAQNNFSILSEDSSDEDFNDLPPLQDDTARHRYAFTENGEVEPTSTRTTSKKNNATSNSSKTAEKKTSTTTSTLKKKKVSSTSTNGASSTTAKSSSTNRSTTSSNATSKKVGGSETSESSLQRAKANKYYSRKEFKLSLQGYELALQKALDAKPKVNNNQVLKASTKVPSASWLVDVIFAISNRAANLIELGFYAWAENDCDIGLQYLEGWKRDKKVKPSVFGDLPSEKVIILYDKLYLRKITALFHQPLHLANLKPLLKTVKTIQQPTAREQVKDYVVVAQDISKRWKDFAGTRNLPPEPNMYRAPLAKLFEYVSVCSRAPESLLSYVDEYKISKVNKSKKNSISSSSRGPRFSMNQHNYTANLLVAGVKDSRHVIASIVDLFAQYTKTVSQTSWQLKGSGTKVNFLINDLSPEPLARFLCFAYLAQDFAHSYAMAFQGDTTTSRDLVAEDASSSTGTSYTFIPPMGIEFDRASKTNKTLTSAQVRVLETGYLAYCLITAKVLPRRCHDMLMQLVQKWSTSTSCPFTSWVHLLEGPSTWQRVKDVYKAWSNVPTTVLTARTLQMVLASAQRTDMEECNDHRIVPTTQSFSFYNTEMMGKMKRHLLDFCTSQKFPSTTTKEENELKSILKALGGEKAVLAYKEEWKKVLKKMSNKAFYDFMLTFHRGLSLHSNAQHPCEVLFAKHTGGVLPPVSLHQHYTKAYAMAEFYKAASATKEREARLRSYLQACETSSTGFIVNVTLYSEPWMKLMLKHPTQYSVEFPGFSISGNQSLRQLVSGLYEVRKEVYGGDTSQYDEKDTWFHSFERTLMDVGQALRDFSTKDIWRLWLSCEEVSQVGHRLLATTCQPYHFKTSDKTSTAGTSTRSSDEYDLKEMGLSGRRKHKNKLYPVFLAVLIVFVSQRFL